MRYHVVKLIYVNRTTLVQIIGPYVVQTKQAPEMGFTGRRIAARLSKNGKSSWIFDRSSDTGSPTSELPGTLNPCWWQRFPSPARLSPRRYPAWELGTRRGLWPTVRPRSRLRRQSRRRVQRRRRRARGMQRVHTIPLRGHPRLRPTRWTPQAFAHSSLTLAQRPTVAPQNPKPIPTPIPVHAGRTHQFQFAHERQPEP